MKLYILSRAQGELSRLNLPEQLLEAEAYSPDSKQGQVIAGLYNVVQYPAYILVSYDGGLIKLWQGAQVQAQTIRDSIAFI